jgi:hypothetical protein
MSASPRLRRRSARHGLFNAGRGRPRPGSHEEQGPSPGESTRPTCWEVRRACVGGRGKWGGGVEIAKGVDLGPRRGKIQAHLLAYGLRVLGKRKRCREALDRGWIFHGICSCCCCGDGHQRIAFEAWVMLWVCCCPWVGAVTSSAGGHAREEAFARPGSRQAQGHA